MTEVIVILRVTGPPTIALQASPFDNTMVGDDTDVPAQALPTGRTALTPATEPWWMPSWPRMSQPATERLY